MVYCSPYNCMRNFNHVQRTGASIIYTGSHILQANNAHGFQVFYMLFFFDPIKSNQSQFIHSSFVLKSCKNDLILLAELI